MSFCYRGLKGQLELVRVSNAELERRLEQLRAQSPAIHAVTDRPSRLGDELLLDYEGYCDGVRFEGGTAENQTLTLGSGMFIPGFEEQLVGKWPGERATVRVTFPAAYPHEALAGKAAEFRCTVREVRVKTEYEMDDVFAREVGGCASLQELREKAAKELRAYYDARAEAELRDRLLRSAAATLEFSPTEEELERAVDEQMETLQAQLAQRGLTVEAYCRFTESTPEQLRADARPEAEETLRILAAVEKIASLEGLSASPEEIERACETICARNHVTMERLRECYDAQMEAAIVRSILTEKVMRLIRETAEVETVEKD